MVNWSSAKFLFSNFIGRTLACSKCMESRTCEQLRLKLAFDDYKFLPYQLQLLR